MSDDLEQIRNRMSESRKEGKTDETIKALYMPQVKAISPALSARKIVEEILKGLDLDHGNGPKPTIIINTFNNSFNNNKSTASDTATPEKTRSKRTKATRVVVNFRHIDDDRLSLADRIVLTFAYAWNFQNKKRGENGKKPRPTSLHRFRATLGMRRTTIKECLKTLTAFGYLTTAGIPIEDHSSIRKRTNGKPEYTKMTLDLGGDIALAVFKEMRAKNYGRDLKPAWWKKALGISRATFFRLKTREHMRLESGNI